MATEPKLIAEWFWTDRWMGSSGFLLPMLARGVYREMLTQAWRRGARLPSDHAAIRRAIGCTDLEWAEAWPQISKYWHSDDHDNLVNDTQLEVYAEAQDKAAGNHARATAAAKARWYNAQRNAQASTNAYHDECPPSPSPSPSLISESDKKQKSGSAAVSVSLAPPKPNGSGKNGTHINGTAEPELANRAARFCERYGVLYQQHRRGARYLPKPSLDWAKACELCAVWPNDRLEMLATVFLKTDHDFAASGSRTIGQFAALASWCDDRLREVETGV